MYISKKLNAILMTLAAAGIIAAASSLVIGFGLMPLGVANAAPATAPEGTLGVGERTVTPVDSTGFGTKVSQDTTEGAAAILSQDAPQLDVIPVPVTRSDIRRAVAGSSSRGSVPSGWQTAKASWYGPGFYGRKTASGAVLTQEMMNVAHKTLPFGTQIQFEYNGRTATAVVNDRGPFIAGRTFDLGPGTAAALGFGGVGTVKYRILGR